jgi:hypothetical protein
MNCFHVNKSLIIDLHEDEWAAWSHMGVPDQHFTVTASTRGSQWSEIHIHPEWHDQFLIMARLHDWHPGYFGKYYGS